MKIVGIKGKRGKTTISNLLRKYLVKLKKQVGIYDGSNFIIYTRKSVLKQNIQTYQDLLNHDYLDYIIVEIHFESFLYKKNLELIKYDVLVDTGLMNGSQRNFKSKEHFDQILEKINKVESLVDINEKDTIYEILKDDLNHLIFKYGSNKYKSKLITSINVKNIILTIKTLIALNIYDFKKFKQIIKDPNLDNNIKIYKCCGKKVILIAEKNVYHNSLNNLTKTINKYNYNVLYEMKNYTSETELKETLNFKEMLKAEKVFFFSSDESYKLNEVKKIITNGFGGKCFNFDVSNNFLDVIKELRRKDVLIILTNDFKERKSIWKKLN